jgi:hypothetical protein
MFELSTLIFDSSFPSENSYVVWEPYSQYGRRTRCSTRFGPPGRTSPRPLRLKRAQAYSTLYYTEGSALKRETDSLWTIWNAGDPVILSRFRPFFKTNPSPSGDVDPPPADANPPPADANPPPADADSLPADANPLPVDADSLPVGANPPPADGRAPAMKARPDGVVPRPDGVDPPADARPPIPEPAPADFSSLTSKQGKRRSRKKGEATRLQTSRGVPFVAFQQAVIREKFRQGQYQWNNSQLSILTTRRHTQELKALDRPCMSSFTEGQAEMDREKEYYEQ